jgi:hypothetical protein
MTAMTTTKLSFSITSDGSKATSNRPMTPSEYAGFKEFYTEFRNHANWFLEDNPKVENFIITFNKLNENCYEISEFVEADGKVLEFWA